MCTPGCPGDPECPPAPQCGGGPCCDPSGTYSAAGTPCGAPTETYVCPSGQGSGTPIDLERSQAVCSGTAASCPSNPETTTFFHKTCQVGTGCQPGSDVCADVCEADGVCILTCPDGVDPDCPRAQCQPGEPCCDVTGRFRGTNHICETDIDVRYTCSGTDVEESTQFRYCDGASGGCQGLLDWTTPRPHDTCAVDEVCSPGDPTCNPAPDPCQGVHCGECLECRAGACVPEQSPGPCTGGTCNAMGVCVATPTRPSLVIDNCTGAHYDRSCADQCDACYRTDTQPGNTTVAFSAHNSTGCTTHGQLQSCLLPYDGFGHGGMLVMFARHTQSAYVRWNFGSTLSGNYRIYADIPDLPGAAADPRCPTGWNPVPDAVYNLNKGNNMVDTQISDHNFDKGTSKLLFQGDLSGATSVTLGNSSSQSACGHFLIDRIRIEPY